MLTKNRKEERAAYYQANKERAKERGKIWAKENPDKRRLTNRKVQVKSTYGLTWDEYLTLYNQAEGRCQICATFLQISPVKDEQNTSACVDHDHKTGKVRGILCRSCNVAIGHLKDSKERAFAAFKYLESYE